MHFIFIQTMLLNFSSGFFILQINWNATFKQLRFDGLLHKVFIYLFIYLFQVRNKASKPADEVNVPSNNVEISLIW